MRYGFCMGAVEGNAKKRVVRDVGGMSFMMCVVS